MSWSLRDLALCVFGVALGACLQSRWTAVSRPSSLVLSTQGSSAKPFSRQAEREGHDEGPGKRLPMCTQTVRILSLDGGGMRGLIGSTVLEELEAIVSEKMGRSVTAGELFDVVVGTSTGGLQAASLMRGHSAATLSSMYMRDSQRIFSNATFNCKPHHRAKMEEHCSLDLYDLPGLIYECLPAVAHCYLSYPQFDSSGAEEVARDYLGNLTTNESFGGRVLGLTSFDLKRGSPVTFTNLGVTPRSTYSLVDAALATSAAPTFFNPRNMTCLGCEADHERLLGVDGALYANSPTLIAYELAEKMAAERLGCQLTPDRALVLSLGTGRERTDLYRTGNLDLSENTLGSVIKTVVQFLEYNDTYWWEEQWGPLKWIFLPLTVPRLELLNAAFIGQEELTDQFFRKVFGASGVQERYVRINVDLSRHTHTSSFSAEPTNVDALRRIGELTAATSRPLLACFADKLVSPGSSVGGLIESGAAQATGREPVFPVGLLTGAIVVALLGVVIALLQMWRDDIADSALRFSGNAATRVAQQL